MERLEEESGIQREEPFVRDFREALLKGDLDFALQQLDHILSDHANKPVLSLRSCRLLNTSFMFRSTSSCLRRGH